MLECGNYIIQLFHAFAGNSQNYRSPGAVDGRPDALLPEAVRPRATVHQVVNSTKGAMVLTVAHEGMK